MILLALFCFTIVIDWLIIYTSLSDLPNIKLSIKNYNN